MEARHDKFGPIWPLSLAPWQVHVCALKLNTAGVADAAERLYRELAAAGLEVVYDDRDERPGVQFAEADLLGVPIRLIVSQRHLTNGEVEWKRRDTGETGTMPMGEAVSAVKRWIEESIAAIETEADERGSS
jgi:prolyl-tRNA synthetase